MRLIDADDLIEAWDLQNCKKYGNDTTEELFDSYETMMRYEIKDMIDDAPTVDAVPVVRCNDCKFFYKINVEKNFRTTRILYCRALQTQLSQEIFCGLGRNKDDRNKKEVKQ